MDKALKEIINKKINETLTHSDEVREIINALSKLSSDKKSFAFGIIIGRLYNSFYYQCRRILKRDPNKNEFLEFLTILQSRQNEIFKKFC
jgi:hypothetical protein